MPKLHARAYSDFTEDALRIEETASVIGCNFTDTRATHLAHRDAIQLIPPSQGQRLQFAAAELCNVKIYGNRIASKGKLQCIFMSDGIARNLRIIGNTLSTQGQHYISIAGLLDGWIEGNIKPDGSYAPILLDPVRLAGEQNVYILSFKDPAYAYRPLPELVDADTLAAGVVRDRRSLRFDPKATYLQHFDLAGFRQALARLDLPREINAYSMAIKQLALRLGK
ncbi:hypothetical protein [uncultured Thiothrix sp.]|uniref:hypothetical protein n=1 Tax=uncultured Thiothrix sp. TaxID=223185 RepID=UPI002638EC58|nr:hypothetical protein [uncultured Thiothrix sp.]